MEKLNKQRGWIKNCCWSLVPPGPQGCCIDPFMQLVFFFLLVLSLNFNTVRRGGEVGGTLSPIRQRRSAVSQPPYWLKHVDKVSTIDFFFPCIDEKVDAFRTLSLQRRRKMDSGDFEKSIERENASIMTHSLYEFNLCIVSFFFFFFF